MISAWPARAPRFEIETYRVFISHRYKRNAEYLRLVRMLDRARSIDPTWRWVNRSIPRDAPIMTREESERANVYERRIRQRLGDVHVVVFILRDEWMDNVNSLYEELVEGVMVPRRPHVPIVGVLPRGKRLEPLRHAHVASVIVKWSTRPLIQAIRAVSIPASAADLRLTTRQAAERRRIVRALETSGGRHEQAAKALKIGASALARKRLHYIIR